MKLFLLFVILVSCLEASDRSDKIKRELKDIHNDIRDMQRDIDDLRMQMAYLRSQYEPLAPKDPEETSDD